MRDGGYGNRDAVLGAQAAVAPCLLRSLGHPGRTLMRYPSGDQPGVGENARYTTGQRLTGADHYRTYRRGVYRHAIAVLLWLAQSPLLVVGNCGMPF